MSNNTLAGIVVLTAAELAEIAKVHTETVRREIRRGNLQAQRCGGQLRISKTEAQRWLGLQPEK